MANLTDADKVIRNDVGKSIASKLDDIADAIVAQGGGAHSLGQLSDVDIDTQTLAEGQSIVYNETTQKFENGEVSTVAALDDLTDVSITSAQKGDSLRNDGNGNWINEPTTIEMTSAEWEAVADKQAWRNAHKNTHLVITDAPNLNETAKQISYDGGADTVWDKVEGKADKAWTYIDKINLNGTCSVSGYSEVLIILYVNNNRNRESFVYPISELSEDTEMHSIIVNSSANVTNYANATVKVASNTLTYTGRSLVGWNNLYLKIYAR